MINQYSSSLKPKIIIIHGLNNTPESFSLLRNYFVGGGFETALVTLPGHGEKRKIKNFDESQLLFHQELAPLIDGPYIVIAFSYGALYFQHWLQEHPDKAPLCQILLAPALYLKKWPIINPIIKALPRFLFIFSQTPRILRRYDKLFLWEYHLLFESIKRFHALASKIPIPTLLLIDPKDELLDVKVMQKSLSASHLDFVVYPRESIRNELGAHHVMFHPEFFEKKAWDEMLKKIDHFILTETDRKS